MEEVLKRCLSLLKRHSYHDDHAAVIGDSPERDFGSFLERFDEDFFEFFKTLKRGNPGAEYYGVGMLIYQFLHREDRCHNEGVQCTLKATFFKRYEKARSKEELDAADRTVLRWRDTSEKLCERLDRHPLHGQFKNPNLETARDRFMERVYLVLGIGRTNRGRDKWFIALDEYETQQKNPGVISQGPSSDKTRHTSEMGGTASATTLEGTLVEMPPTTIGTQDKDV